MGTRSAGPANDAAIGGRLFSLPAHEVAYDLARRSGALAGTDPAARRWEGFEEAFSNTFEILDVHPVKGSERTIYLMRRRD